MIVNTDIDIDVADRQKLLRLIKHTPAMMINNKGHKKRHNTGVYFHEVPIDPFTGLSTVDYSTSDQLGFFKIDILNVNIYESIKTPAELDELLEIEPMWELLEHGEIVEKLFHIHSHYDIVKRMRPRSVEQLAAVLAVIRPAKRYLLGKDWDTVNREVWVRPEGDEYFFKKAHAVSYAVAIVVQLNQLVKNSFSSN
jgi:hypothetical protein